MSADTPHDKPSIVHADCGEILLDGPNGLAAAFTPDAAEETGRRLLAAAQRARSEEREGREKRGFPAGSPAK